MAGPSTTKPSTTKPSNTTPSTTKPSTTSTKPSTTKPGTTKPGVALKGAIPTAFDTAGLPKRHLSVSSSSTASRRSEPSHDNGDKPRHAHSDNGSDGGGKPMHPCSPKPQASGGSGSRFQQELDKLRNMDDDVAAGVDDDEDKNLPPGLGIGANARIAVMRQQHQSQVGGRGSGR